MGMNLIKAGYSLTVWNRTASRAMNSVRRRRQAGQIPQEVAAASGFLLTIVSDPPRWKKFSGTRGAVQALQRGKHLR